MPLKILAKICPKFASFNEKKFVESILLTFFAGIKCIGDFASLQQLKTNGSNLLFRELW